MHFGTSHGSNYRIYFHRMQLNSFSCSRYEQHLLMRQWIEIAYFILFGPNHDLVEVRYNFASSST
jgi:hypothetical protein